MAPRASAELHSPGDAVEVIARWGTSVFRPWHLSPPRAFDAGEGLENDLVLPIVGAAPKQLLRVARGVVHVLVPAGTCGRLQVEEGAVPGDRALAYRRATPSTVVEAGVEVALVPGLRVIFSLAGVEIGLAGLIRNPSLTGRIWCDQDPRVRYKHRSSKPLASRSPSLAPSLSLARSGRRLLSPSG